MSSIMSSPSVDLGRRGSEYLSNESLALCLDSIVHKHMADFDAYILNPVHRKDCLLGDIGAMLVRIMMVVSRLSEDLVSRNHIDEYTKIEIERMRSDHDFSEFGESDYLLITEERLRNMLSMVRHTASTVKEEWAKAPARPIPTLSDVSSSAPPSATCSPEPEYQPALVLSTTPLTSQAPVPGIAPNVRHIDQNSGRHPSVSEVFEQSRRISPESYAGRFPDLDVLKMRGKGTYNCPQGFACKKGGVVDGRLVLFERNCNFRAHIQKHQKPYKCHLPGCLNKQGFARIDQLKRHQHMVKHDLV